jgi:hypothetical protein
VKGGIVTLSTQLLWKLSDSSEVRYHPKGRPTAFETEYDLIEHSKKKKLHDEDRGRLLFGRPRLEFGL